MPCRHPLVVYGLSLRRSHDADDVIDAVRCGAVRPEQAGDGRERSVRCKSDQLGEYLFSLNAL